jgi:uncharacterized protein with HEPN domain
MASYVFEILCIDPQDITSESALVKALGFSSQLWNNNPPKEIHQKGRWTLVEEKSKIALGIKQVDTSKVLTDYFEAAFLLRAESENFDGLEAYRIRLMRHVRHTLKFNHVRLLTDDISTYIANRLYPEINHVESLLRKYLTKFFVQRVGLNWWEATATRVMSEKVKSRQVERFRDEISELADLDVSLADFDDLGELIYKQSSGFNNPEKIISKLLTLNTVEELQGLQLELQGNYTKYFKEFFQDKNFEPKWRELYRIRNKVAHQGTFYRSEMERALELVSLLTKIITEAENKIDEIVFSIEEKEAIRDATIAATRQEEVQTEEKENEDPNYFRGGLQGLKILGKIDLEPSRPRLRFITENELLSALEDAEESKYTSFVGLKWFVTIFLFNRGFAIPTSYSLLNILIDKGNIEVFDVRAHEGYDIKAIRLIHVGEDAEEEGELVLTELETTAV